MKRGAAAKLSLSCSSPFVWYRGLRLSIKCMVHTGLVLLSDQDVCPLPDTVAWFAFGFFLIANRLRIAVIFSM